MLDIKFVRENPEIVKENIKKKFQDAKLPLVDEVIAIDAEVRSLKQKISDLRAERNSTSNQIGGLMREGKKDEAMAMKSRVVEINDMLVDIEKKEEELSASLKDKMMIIPNILDASVPVGKDDTENVENQKYGDPVVPNYEIPYHADIIDRFNGLDKDASGRTSGNGFYYL
ncbi:MAG: serine--tRNA ligase, partial [Bacilli bacterium]|nr:serine--tRNA ligase [Bacilli bacterium]